MNSICNKIRNILAEKGPSALQHDRKALDHLAECPDCFGFLEALSALDAGFHALPEIDAPDLLVATLLARPEIAGRPSAQRSIVARNRSTRWRSGFNAITRTMRPRMAAWASAAAAALVLVILLSPNLRKEMQPATTGMGYERRERKANSNAIESKTETSSSQPGQRAADQIDRSRLKDGVVEGEIAERRVESTKDEDRVLAADAPAEAGAAMQDMRSSHEAAKPDAEQANVLDAITVTGSNIRRADIETRNPVIELDRAQLQLPAQKLADGQGLNADAEAVFGSASNTPSGYSAPPAPPALPAPARERPVNAGAVGKSDAMIGREATDDKSAKGAERQAKVSQDISGPTADWTHVSEIGAVELAKKDRDEPGLPDSTPKSKAVKQQSEELDKEISRAASGGKVEPRLVYGRHAAPRYPDAARRAGVEAAVDLLVTVRADGSVSKVSVVACNQPGFGFEAAAISAVRQWRYEPVSPGGASTAVQVKARVAFTLNDPQSSNQSAPALDPVRIEARHFLAEREQVQGLGFQPASGYWSNSYVPGDPVMRTLQSRLASASVLTHEQARPAVQPFDPPESSALAVYLHADRRGINAEGRVLVQVGLQGSARQGGRRPAMNIAVVLDMRGQVSVEDGIGFRALLDALNQAIEPGDRFRVVLAGRAGATIIEPQDFRHGVLRVTMDQLLGASDGATTQRAEGRPTLDLVQATASAIAQIAANDDPTAPLGSSSVILVTSQSLGSSISSLANLAHQSAVAGVPLSVVGIGSKVDMGSLDALALAGQGARRLLDSPAQASALIERELSSSSSAVARAVRLRIRLAPGVKLVDVIGSERLDESRAQRVRDVEQSLDLRLSRNLGIEADRGEDEEGIQIVIPSYYAGDSQVILLDLVVSGPGPVADVTVRYKDLVELRNGVSRASLSLADKPRAAGPLERNVMKNLLSRRLSEALDQAGQDVAAGQSGAARKVLERSRDLLNGLRLELPGLRDDPDLGDDLAMLSEYCRLLASATEAIAVVQLSESLRYAALLKLHSRPLEIRS
jgi:TonB family protein